MPESVRGTILVVAAAVGMLVGAVGFTYGITKEGIRQFAEIQRTVLYRITVIETSYANIKESLKRIETTLEKHAAE